MKSIFETETKNELLNRIEKLNQESNALWGKMDVSQMLWHCQFMLKVAVKNKDKGNGKFPMKLFKKSLYSNKPYRKGLPTPKFLVAIESKKFTDEKIKIIALVNQTHDLKKRIDWNPHPVFGKFTRDQWGILEFKHLDHHLRQFGV